MQSKPDEGLSVVDWRLETGEMLVISPREDRSVLCLVGGGR